MSGIHKRLSCDHATNEPLPPHCQGSMTMKTGPTRVRSVAGGSSSIPQCINYYLARLRLSRVTTNRRRIEILVMIVGILFVTSCVVLVYRMEVHYSVTSRENVKTNERRALGDLRMEANIPRLRPNINRNMPLSKLKAVTRTELMGPSNATWGTYIYGPNGTYHHSDSIKDLGDITEKYAKLREKYDEWLPEHDTNRMSHVVQTLRQRDYQPMNHPNGTYHVWNCPDEPPLEYPMSWNVLDVLDHWEPDDITPRSHIYQGICRFNYRTERHKALNYRRLEVPYVIRDDPMVQRTVERWNHEGYMEELLGSWTKYPVEYSENNHFMYWTIPKKKNKKKVDQIRPGDELPEGWKEPTTHIDMSYKKWLSHANVTDESQLGPNMEHWYFRLTGCGKMKGCEQPSEYLFDELAFFQPRKENELYMVKPHAQKGIHCRFGMEGVIAENHFDRPRNMIALLRGERRYILSHPDQCENLELYPIGHPSARHSAVDWSNPDLEKHLKFKHAQVNEIVLQAGDVLYIPSNWFHYIISLDLNFQCNTRSGTSSKYMDELDACGF